jgi:hypothetical protein
MNETIMGVILLIGLTTFVYGLMFLAYKVNANMNETKMAKTVAYLTGCTIEKAKANLKAIDDRIRIMNESGASLDEIKAEASAIYKKLYTRNA